MLDGRRDVACDRQRSMNVGSCGERCTARPFERQPCGDSPHAETVSPYASAGPPHAARRMRPRRHRLHLTANGVSMRSRFSAIVAPAVAALHRRVHNGRGPGSARRQPHVPRHAHTLGCRQRADCSTDRAAVKWRFATRSAVRSTPAVTATRVFVGSGDSTLYALDRASGTLIWKFDAGGPVHASPAVAQRPRDRRDARRPHLRGQRGDRRASMVGARPVRRCRRTLHRPARGTSTHRRPWSSARRS